MKERDKNTKSLSLSHNRKLDLSQPAIMGIINNTPDSFYASSRKETRTSIVEQAGQMLREGAAILDLGGYSSRPGAEDISPAEEAERLIPAITAIKEKHPEAIVSADTFRTEIASKALKAGADIINDISGGQLDPEMDDFIVQHQLPYIVMHMRGTPQTMKSLTTYDDLLGEVRDFLRRRKAELQQKGHEHIVFDPGFGFSKTIDQNYAMLKNLEYFHDKETPLLVGLSRKSMIYKTLNHTPEESLNGTTVLNTLAIINGADILRVHDVKEAQEVIQISRRYQQS